MGGQSGISARGELSLTLEALILRLEAGDSHAKLIDAVTHPDPGFSSFSSSYFIPRLHRFVAPVLTLWL